MVDRAIYYSQISRKRERDEEKRSKYSFYTEVSSLCVQTVSFWSTVILFVVATGVWLDILLSEMKTGQSKTFWITLFILIALSDLKDEIQ